MISIDVWETIRIRCRRDGEKIKTVARDLGLAPNTVRGYLPKDSPPKRKPRADVKTLTRYQSHIDNFILSTPKITAARIGSYLRQNVDSDLVADERTLRRYVAGRRAVLVPREAFIRASYGPGDQSQFDFSPMSCAACRRGCRAAETALVLADGRIPQVLHELFARYREDNGGTATRGWTQGSGTTRRHIGRRPRTG